MRNKELRVTHRGSIRRSLTWRIDTTEAEQGTVTVTDAKGVRIAQRSFSLAVRSPGVLLTCIAAVGRSARTSIRDAAAIDVVPGPGTFSRVRLGVVTANALAWSLGVPLIVRGKRVRIATPVYGKPPNITLR
ncbi:hypothetical protein HY634_01690 [Candidatus Uhrbacteria bacterium]|nr:hypothetical protein [Candidatus Uhrbacteria bacterium]